MNNLIVLGGAQRDLEDIGRKHLEIVGSVSAVKIVEKIYASMELLRCNPYMGISVDEDELKGLGFRKVISGMYICIYRLEGDKVYIYHVADGRTEYKRIFRDLPHDKN